MGISHFNESLLTLSDFFFDNFISTVIIKVEFFLDFVHLNKKKGYDVLDIKTVMIKDVPDVLDF